jgi:hypothetical protein
MLLVIMVITVPRIHCPPHPPTTHTTRPRRPAAAEALLRRMGSLGLRRSLLTYNAALLALAPAGRWRQVYVYYYQCPHYYYC